MEFDRFDLARSFSDPLSITPPRTFGSGGGDAGGNSIGSLYGAGKTPFSLDGGGFGRQARSNSLSDFTVSTTAASSSISSSGGNGARKSRSKSMSTFDDYGGEGYSAVSMAQLLAGNIPGRSRSKSGNGSSTRSTGGTRPQSTSNGGRPRSTSSGGGGGGGASSRHRKDAKANRKSGTCMCCSSSQTPLWREGKNGVRLCNACGIRWVKYGIACSKCNYVPRKNESKGVHCPKCDEVLPPAEAIANRRRSSSVDSPSSLAAASGASAAVSAAGTVPMVQAKAFAPTVATPAASASSSLTVQVVPLFAAAGVGAVGVGYTPNVASAAAGNSTPLPGQTSLAQAAPAVLLPASIQQHLQAQQLHAQQLHAQQLHAQQLHAQQLHAQQLHAQQLYTQNLHAQQLQAQQLQAQQLQAQQLQAPASGAGTQVFMQAPPTHPMPQLSFQARMQSPSVQATSF